ncbi:MAG: sigma-70 family RNA polymerase sigma factor [Oscillospiraceae bacterium]|nr:sigma-70 family RNA polymerase sigma factor [Oscillospiraceae bacterium]
MNEVFMLINDKNFLDSLYGFAYKRTNNSYEAEDLCSDIVLAILSAVHKNSDINNPYAFVWTVARRVYADFSEKRKYSANAFITGEYSDEVINVRTDPIDEYLESENDKTQIRRIMREICFLSKIYRDVCVMYYLDEMKISDIAKRLEITENAVKQRLHSARETIKKGAKKMNTTNLTLNPIDIVYLGSGNPVGNDPRTVAERSFSKNLVYLCKNTERSAKELADILGVPMPFVEEEVEIQLKGQNGYYGLIKKTENGKYISNFIIIDYDDYMKVNEMYKKNTDIITQKFDSYIKKNEQKILGLPFLNKQTDVRFIAWSLISRVNWWFSGNVEERIEEKYFSNIEPTKRDLFIFGIAAKEGKNIDTGFYGSMDISGNDIGGYKEVFLSNIQGRRINKHFSCGHNISQDIQLLLTIKAINGLPLSSLSEEEKETAAKAIESGYIRRENDTLYPKILVSENSKIYADIINDFIGETNELIEPVVDEMYKFIQKYVPKHLMGEYKLFVNMTASGLLDGMIEKCIELGTLIPPEKTPSAEGVIMVVTK